MMPKKKKKQAAARLRCPYCGKPALLRPASYVYNDVLEPDRYLYVCTGYPECDAYIGVHRGSLRPMGMLADADLRHKRIEAHRALNALWEEGYLTKRGAYIWLQNRLGLSEKETHIGMFSYYRCEETIRECTSLLEQRRKLAGGGKALPEDTKKSA